MEVHEHPARFKVVVRGRRGGKTEEELQGAVRDAVTDPGLHWVVGPSYKQIKAISWTRAKAIVKPDPLWRFNEQELYMEHPAILDKHGIATRIEFKGCDNEDSLVGVGLKSLRVDEAALVKRAVWEKVLRPMLADHKAPATFYSTPRGRNWFWESFLKGQDENELEWMSWRHPTHINGYIDNDEIEEARKDMSERLFNQEFMAEFLSDDTGVFKGVRRCSVGELKPPVVGRYYVVGVDLAKTLDFTAMVVLDSVTREVVAFERFQDVSWVEQKVRIGKLATRYNNAMVVLDSTGVGDPIYDDLLQTNISITGYKFNSNTQKVQLIDQLAITIEQRQVTFPPELEILIDELQAYEYRLTDHGNITYNAPDGKHDDCVIALGLAVWGIRNQLHEAQVVQHSHDEYDRDRQGHGYKVEQPQVIPNVGRY